MGVLVDGVWRRDETGFKMDPSKQAGTFHTPHEQIQVEGGGRYFLYVCDGCPWAARPWMCAVATGMAQAGVIRIVRVFPGNKEDGWFFSPVSDSERSAVENVGSRVDWDRVEPYSNGEFTHLHHVYTAGDPAVTGRVTVPLLFDTKTKTCISSESEDLVSILLSRFRPLHVTPVPSLYPLARRTEIHAMIKVLTREVNSIVYGIHFSKSQAVFESKVAAFKATLTRIDAALGTRPWLLEGTADDEPSVLDLILFATIVRFDIAYAPRFRITGFSVRRDFPVLWHHCCRVFCLAGIQDCIHWQGILCMYYHSWPLIVKAGITVGALQAGYEDRLNAVGRTAAPYHLPRTSSPAGGALLSSSLRGTRGRVSSDCPPPSVEDMPGVSETGVARGRASSDAFKIVAGKEHTRGSTCKMVATPSTSLSARGTTATAVLAGMILGSLLTAAMLTRTRQLR